MTLWLYNLITSGYFAGIRIAARFSAKANKWVKGRKGLFDLLERDFSKRKPQSPLLWMHCASLGEFEQGRPLLEALRREQPSLQILLTFYSPSGFEIRKNYPVANWIHYLPADGAINARRFLDIVRPDVAIFVKYEFWYHFLSALRKREIPLFLIAAVFRAKHPFFKWYGGLHREMLAFFTRIFVQDGASFELVSTITNTPVQLAGDTRVDRVAAVARQKTDLPQIAHFCGDAPVLVCGSTWPEDENLIQHFAASPAFQQWKIILAPHDVQPSRIEALEKLFRGMSVRYSAMGNMKSKEASQPRLLIIDNIGLLAKLYRFGKIAYVGGGFGRGIHNTLEPIAYRIPVVFGPHYSKFAEAEWLAANGGGFPVAGEADFMGFLGQLQDDTFYEKACGKAMQYILENQGATERCLVEIRPWVQAASFQNSL